MNYNIEAKLTADLDYIMYWDEDRPVRASDIKTEDVQRHIMGKATEQDLLEYRQIYKWECICDVFSISTYDGNLSEIFAKRILKAFEIADDKDGAWCKYIDDKENYIWLIGLYNMFDLYDFIEWGTSIRSSWLEPKGQEVYAKLKEFINNYDDPKKNC